MEIDFLADLNETQQQAVKAIDGPVLVIAGAGSGKTRVLTYRIAFLLKKGIKPENILALTFTNKAAGEMKERIANIAGRETARYLWMGTFHSIFARILRQEGERLGYQQNFTIYDASDSKNLVRAIIKELQLDDKVYKPGAIASRISSAKNNLITAGSYEADSRCTEADKSNRIPLFAGIYRTYQERCFRSNTMDFDDLLLNTNILFRDFPSVLELYQKRFSHILVDEYQDTNYSQYLIVNKLAAKHQNLCVVGDDAQSIYSFRGARIENILHFKTDYPEHKIFKLEQNYRSTQTIVNAANGVIANNTGQIQKTVFSQNEQGDNITIFQATTDIEEGVIISADIDKKKRSSNLGWNDFAILYRTNAQSRIFEETLRKNNIPYKIYGGQSFYDRKEIRDVLAYFRVVINHNDEEALRRIINYPKRGIGDTTVNRLFEISKQNGTPLWDTITKAHLHHSSFNSGTISKLNQFVETIDKLSSNLNENEAYTKAVEIVDIAGIKRDLKESREIEDLNRIDNIDELLNGIKIFTEDASTNGDPSLLGNYMEGVALLTDQDNEKEGDFDKVTLMTIHSAKGLEFKHVYIVGFEDTLFPSPMSIDSVKDLEEERRLFYVALTRAEKQVTISYALNRYKWGNLEFSRPSRFLKELDKSLLSYPQSVDKEQQPVSSRNWGTEPAKKRESFFPGRNTLREPEISIPKRNNLKKIVPQKSSNVPSGYNETSLSEGDRVVHERFGKGVVVSIEGEPPNNTATVDFEESGSKKLLLRFARLNKL
jgi:DNA helicase-2/ATP-dependent DNA helicase PcrA